LRRPLSRVDPWLAGDVDDDLVDRVADERPGRVAGVVVDHRLGSVSADVEPYAGEG
jgi:hypothetical protein